MVIASFTCLFKVLLESRKIVISQIILVVFSMLLFSRPLWAGSAPTMSIISPSSPVSLLVGESKTFKAEATAGSGIKGIEWFLGSVSEKYTNYTGSWDYYQQESLTTTFNVSGTHYVHAYVYDRETSQREALVTWEVIVELPIRSGDINSDGIINLDDAENGLQVLSSAPLTNNINIAGDTNGNSRIDMADIIYIQRKRASFNYTYFEDFQYITGWNDFLANYEDWFDASQHGNPRTEWDDPMPGDLSGYQVRSDEESNYLSIKTAAGTHDRPKLMTRKRFSSGIFEWRVFIPDNMFEGAEGGNTAIAAWLYDKYSRREIDFEIGWGPRYQRTESGLTDEESKVLLHMTVQPVDLESSSWEQPDGQFRYKYAVIEAGFWYTFKIELGANGDKYMVEWFFKKDGQEYPNIPAHRFETPYGPSDTAFSIACSVENFTDTPAWLGGNSPPIMDHSAKFDFVGHKHF